MSCLEFDRNDGGYRGREQCEPAIDGSSRPFPVSRSACLGPLFATPVAGQSHVSSQNADPLLGTWLLDVSKSRYSPGPAPKSQTRTYEKHRLGIRATVKTVHADGRSTTVQSVYNYDNMEHPVTGSEGIDAIVMKRVDTYTSEATLTHASRDGHAPSGHLKRRQIDDGNPPENFSFG